jgi:hypothetical protein
MVYLQHLEILKQGAGAWNAWRDSNPTIVPDFQFADLRNLDLGAHTPSSDPVRLAGADFRGANLDGVNFEYAHLSGSNFAGATLKNSVLRVARMSGADFTNADLSHSVCDSEYDGDLASITDLRHAILINANLSFASLRDIDLGGANLTRATFLKAKAPLSSFAGAIFDSTVIVDSDLAGAHGFETSIHSGPSYIDKASVEQSNGLPINFLRGLGVSEASLEGNSSLVGGRAQYFSAFISYSSKDNIFAERLKVYLESKGVRVWFAPEDLKIGDSIGIGLQDAVHRQDKVILILSGDSVKSTWVQREVEFALEEEKNRKVVDSGVLTVLAPVRLDNAVFECEAPWARELCETRNIGDFSEWRRAESFNKCLAKLLRDLERPRRGRQ